MFDNQIMVSGFVLGFFFIQAKIKQQILSSWKNNNIETLSINYFGIFIRSGDLMFQTEIISNECFIAYICMKHCNHFTHACLPRFYEQWRYL